MNSFLFVLPTDSLGGAERVAKTLATHLLECGKSVEVLFVTQEKSNGWHDLIAAYPKFKINYVKANRQRNGLLKSISILSDTRSDVVYSTTVIINSFLSTMRLFRLLKCEYLISRESTDVFKRFNRAEVFFRRCLYFFYGSQDLLIYQTEEMKRNYESHIPKLAKINNKVIKNPIQIDLIRCLAGQLSGFVQDNLYFNGFKLIFVGRLCDVKNPKFLLQSLAFYKAHFNSKFRCAIIGNGDLHEELYQDITDLNLVDNVFLLGRIANPFPIMKWADVGVLTSKHEGFPNVINEMICAGTGSIVSTNCVDGLESIPHVAVSRSKSSIDFAKLIHIAYLAKNKGHHAASTSDFSERQIYLESIDVSEFYKAILSAL